MSTERKEGILIATISIVVLLVLALLTDWKSSEMTRHGTYETEARTYIFDFSLHFKTILIFALPIFSYGILRAFGIVRRLFPFEENLFRYVDEKKKDNLLTPPPAMSRSYSDEVSQPPKKKHWSEKDLDI